MFRMWNSVRRNGRHSCRIWRTSWAAHKLVKSHSSLAQDGLLSLIQVLFVYV